MTAQDQPVLVAGAETYAASLLIPALAAAGFSVRAMSHKPTAVRRRDPTVELVPARRDPAALQRALDGVGTAYYLRRAGGEGEEAVEEAERFRGAAETAGVLHLVYLGALAHGEHLTEWARTSAEVGRALASGEVSVTELRAAPVLGRDSAAFEVVRRLPATGPSPRWAEVGFQPIAGSDLAAYLVRAASMIPGLPEALEIGGGDVVTYRDLATIYRRHRRPGRAVPGAAWSSSLYPRWLALASPASAHEVKAVTEGLSDDMVVRSEHATTRFPEINPKGAEEALQEALDASRG